MNDQAYDKKNSDDYEENTFLLKKALSDIESNKKLKATIAQLSAMSGVHRNTISNRVWPVQELNKIKSIRKARKTVDKEKVRSNTVDIKKILEEKLTQARNEIIYWFNEYQDMKRFANHSDKQYQKMRDSRDYYKTLYEKDRISLLEAKQELIKLKEKSELELTQISSNQLKH